MIIIAQIWPKGKKSLVHVMVKLSEWQAEEHHHTAHFLKSDTVHDPSQYQWHIILKKKMTGSMATSTTTPYNKNKFRNLLKIRK